MAHGVPLIAQKRTVARVYLSVGGPDAVTVSGVIRVRRVGSSGLGTAIRAQAPLTIDPALNGNLRLKRESETRSLNFILPRQVLTAGQWEVRLSSLNRVQPHRALTVPAGASRTVTFTTSPPLRVRLIGIRFQAPGAVTVTPTPLDFTLIQSWLGRAYPVASVEWSQVTVDGPSAWPFEAPAINAFVRAIRTADVAGGVDARTHYYGLVGDNGAATFMRGLASGIPTTAGSHHRGVGPVRRQHVRLGHRRLLRRLVHRPRARDTPSGASTPSSAAPAAARPTRSPMASSRTPTGRSSASTSATSPTACRCGRCPARHGTTS